MNNKGSGLTPAQALDKLDALYEQSVVALRNAIGKYITSGELPDENARKQGLFVYPSLTVTWDGSTTNPPKTRAFGRFTHAGSYTTTITRPTLFRSYLNEQLTLLYQDYGAHISVQPSQHEIPYPYVIDGSELTLDRSMSAGLTRYFPTTELAQIGDETADGIYIPEADLRLIGNPLVKFFCDAGNTSGVKSTLISVARHDQFAAVQAHLMVRFYNCVHHKGTSFFFCRKSIPDWIIKPIFFFSLSDKRKLEYRS